MSHPRTAETTVSRAKPISAPTSSTCMVCWRWVVVPALRAAEALEERLLALLAEGGRALGAGDAIGWDLR